MKTLDAWKRVLSESADVRWGVVFAGGLVCLGIWDLAFLNGPALKWVARGFFNTCLIALVSVVLTLGASWGATWLRYFLEYRSKQTGLLLLSFVLNLVRSIPQVVGVLLFYALIAHAVDTGKLASQGLIILLMSACLSLFIFIEVADLMWERITHFRQSDFVDALRVCGVSENRILNFDILWKNSRIHILNKLIAAFGMAVFLQCSVDFIISVGLSTEMSGISLPTTLGGLLAKLDSKQDILAIGYTLTHPTYLPRLFFAHLQGLSTAFLIVFTLLCTYKVSTAYSERHRL